MDEAHFLKMLLANPHDDTTRLVYADWLEETGSDDAIAKAKFLRLTVYYAQRKKSKRSRKKIEKQLQGSAASLDTEWLAVVSHLRIENCAGIPRPIESPSAMSIRFEFQCDREWQDLTPTDDITKRYCDGCKQNVHYCATIMEARKHTWEDHCIAVDLGIPRREGDLEARRMLVGKPSAKHLREQLKLAEPDTVSIERAKQKKA